MGFSDIPAPKVDACVTQANNLVAQINSLDASLAATRRTIEATNAQLSTIAGRITEIEDQYPNRQLPPDVYATYTSLVDQYNRLLGENEARIDAFNRSVDQRNTLARQPLRC
jgi:outer membrane murein-binding lipoprotein Lpp